MAKQVQRRAALSIGAILGAGICLAGALFAWLWWHGEGEPLAIQQVASAAPPDAGQRSDLDQHLADPRSVLSRRDLVTFVRVLGSASLADKERLRSAIVGRRFRVEVPFGCGAALTSNPTTSAHWWYDEKDRALRLQAVPDLWAVTEGQSSAREIYWITRPQDRSCEAASTGSSAISSAPRPRIGLAVLNKPAPRVVTRWDSYSSAFVASPSEAADLGRGLRLLLEGVVERDESQALTLCNRHPGDDVADCAVAARLERVGFLNAANGIVLAEWDGSGHD